MLTLVLLWALFPSLLCLVSHLRVTNMSLKWQLFFQGLSEVWKGKPLQEEKGSGLQLSWGDSVFICEINKNLGEGADVSDLSAHQDESAKVLDEVTLSAQWAPYPEFIGPLIKVAVIALTLEKSQSYCSRCTWLETLFILEGEGHFQCRSTIGSDTWLVCRLQPVWCA